MRSRLITQFSHQFITQFAPHLTPHLTPQRHRTDDRQQQLTSAPLESAIAQPSQRSRRRFLGDMAGIVGLGLLPSLPTPKGMVQRVLAQNSSTASSMARVLVVGAGVAGLLVAYRLQQAGVPIDIVEASPRVGGRLRSLRSGGSYPGLVELGGEFIDSSHRAVRSVAAELGLELADLELADWGLEPEVLYFQGQRLTQEWIVEEFAPLGQRIAEDLVQLGSADITYHNPSPIAVALDRMSLAEYLDQVSMHPIMRELVRVAYLAEYGLDAEEQSCFNLLFLIGTETGKWQAYGLSDERYHVIGGNQQIPQRLAQRINGLIATGTALESVRQRSDGRYQVSLRSDMTSLERVYDHVVLTLPLTMLRQVELAIELPPAKQAAIRELSYGTHSKLSIPFAEKIWRTRYETSMTTFTDLKLQNAWESARYLPQKHGWVTTLRGGQGGIALGEGSPAEQAAAMVTELEQIFPGMATVERGAAVRSVWVNDPYVLGSYSCYRPGQRTCFGGAEGERVGNLWFAGEHCSIASQGFMNGACETAEQVVAGIVRQV